MRRFLMLLGIGILAAVIAPDVSSAQAAVAEMMAGA
jgi:hypothetical protein